MKTAEEWLEVSKKIELELMKLPKIDNLTQAVDNSFAIKLFKQIQLDAYKAGIVKSAQIHMNHPPSEHHECQQAFLAEGNKTEL